MNNKELEFTELSTKVLTEDNIENILIDDKSKIITGHGIYSIINSLSSNLNNLNISTELSIQQNKNNINFLSNALTMVTDISSIVSTAINNISIDVKKANLPYFSRSKYIKFDNKALYFDFELLKYDLHIDDLVNNVKLLILKIN